MPFRSHYTPFFLQVKQVSLKSSILGSKVYKACQDVAFLKDLQVTLDVYSYMSALYFKHLRSCFVAKFNKDLKNVLAKCKSSGP